MANNCQLPQFLPLLPTQDQPEKAKYALLTNHRGCSTSSWPPTASSSPQLPLGVHLSPPLMMKPTPPLPSLRLCQHASEGAAFLLEQAKHTASLVLICVVFIHFYTFYSFNSVVHFEEHMPVCGRAHAHSTCGCPVDEKASFPTALSWHPCSNFLTVDSCCVTFCELLSLRKKGGD